MSDIQISNIDDLFEVVGSVMKGMLNGEVNVRVGKEVNNGAGKFLKGADLQMKFVSIQQNFPELAKQIRFMQPRAIEDASNQEIPQTKESKEIKDKIDKR